VVVGRAARYAQRCEPAISGQLGHNDTLKRVAAVGVGFDLDEDTAYAILAEHWNPRCEPPWSEKDLRRKIREAWKTTRKEPGYLLRDDTADANGQPHGGGPAPPAGVKPLPDTYTAAELMAIELGEIKWSVPGIIPEGASILAAPPKMGKSWLILGTCIAVATGGLALGKVRVDPGECLYLALEDGRRRLQGRLRKLLAVWGGTAPPRLHFRNAWRRIDEGGLDDLSRWLTEHPACRLVVIDTLQRMRKTTAGSANQYAIDYDAMAQLQALALRQGIAIVVVHHTRKGRPGDATDLDPLETVSGTMGLTGAADAVLVLKRKRNQKLGTLSVTGRDVEEREIPLTWDPQYCHWEQTEAATGPDADLTPDRRAVRQAIRDAGHPLGVSDLCLALKKAGIPKDYEAVLQLLCRMVREGFLDRAGKGRYKLPDDTVSGSSGCQDDGPPGGP
jgi:hypothetical protein